MRDILTLFCRSVLKREKLSDLSNWVSIYPLSAGAALRGHFTWYVIFRLRCDRNAGKILYFSNAWQQYRNTKSGRY